MSQRTETIAQRVMTFSNEVIALVETLSDGDWNKICDWEQWSAGVTAHHIGAGHLAIFNMAAMIVKGEELPQLTMDQINAMSNQQAKENANCTKAETLNHIRTNRDKMVAFITGLSDDDLDRKGSMPAVGGDVTTEQLIEYVIFQSAAQHFDNIKAAVGDK
jgi:hypothetical protein